MRLDGNLSFLGAARAVLDPWSTAAAVFGQGLRSWSDGTYGQNAVGKCLWMFSSTVSRRTPSAIALPTITRSKGSRVHERLAACWTMFTNGSSETLSPTRSASPLSTTAPDSRVRPISKSAWSSSCTIGLTLSSFRSSTLRIRRSLRSSFAQSQATT